MRRPRTIGIISAAFAAMLGGVLVAPSGATAAEDGAAPSADKLASELVSQFKDDSTLDFWVKLNVHADNAQAREMDDWDARGTRVAAQLRSVADRTQAPVRELLDERGIAYSTHWITNAINVQGGTKELALELAEIDVVGQVLPPLELVQDEPFQGVELPKVDAVEWGIADINADDVWADYGITGEGIVVANIDTGVDYDHPALINKYRGNLGGGEFDNNYNWYDVTGASEFPTDGDIHGTHTMGTIVGGEGANQIGVAPGAEWIASNALMGSIPQFLDAMEWMLEPRDLDGNNPDASKRPNVISNSWGISGVPTDPFGDDIQQAWIDSGIFGTWSNRNLGPACDTTGSPGGRALSYSNGAYDINHVIASFSSRGPGQDGMIKPNISGPGVNVRSSVPGGGYSALSGTSMSTPHLAGSVALLWSAAPALIGDIEATREIFNESAIDVDATECGGTVENNNVFGEGRLDVLGALESAPIGDTGTVSGTVTDAATGDPIEGATLTFVGESTREATTDADGDFRVLLVAGVYEVSVHVFGYVDAVETIEVEKDTTTDLDFALDEAERYVLIGRVRDRATGTRLPDVAVTIAGTDLTTTTNKNGGYRFESVPAGTYDITASGNGCYLSRTKEAVIDGEWPRDELDFKGDERKRFRLGAKVNDSGYTCRTEASDYVEGDTAVDFGGDEKMTMIDLPFSFPFFGDEYDEVQLSTNGHARFVESDDAAYANQHVPDPTEPNGVVAAFWDDLIIDSQASVWSRTSGDVFSIEYRNVKLYDTNSRVDFTTTFHSNGEIVITYRGIKPGSPVESGESATVGIENADGSLGLQYAADEALLSSNTAVRFVPVG